MNHSIFEKLENEITEFTACWAAIRAGDSAAKDVIFGIRGRLAANREYRSDRLSEIERKLEDNTLSATMRKMLVQERDSLKTAEDAPTSIETAAFESAISQMETALSDVAKLRPQLEAAFRQAEAELKRTRGETLANSGFDTVMVQNWIDGKKRDFNNLNG